MAGGDDEVSFKIDLDTKEALSSLVELKGTIEKLADSSSVTHLAEGLLQVGAVAGGLAATFYGIRTAIETVFEAENIKAINAQFDILSKNAGVAGEQLKTALTIASAGLIDDTNLTKLANQGFVELGTSAARLPEIMEVARKTTAIFGGDLESNFRGISEAIASGNLRALKHQGIILDINKVYADYAQKLGLAEDELSKVGQQQALLNAVIDQSKTSLAGIDPDLKKAQNSWLEFKVAISQMFETMSLAFERVMGGPIRSFLGTMTDMAKSVQNFMGEAFGTGEEKASAHLNQLRLNLKKTEDQLQSLEDRQKNGSWIVKVFGSNQSTIDGLKQKVSELKEEIKKDEAEIGASAEAANKKLAPHPMAAQEAVDQRKRAENTAKFNKDMADLEKKRADLELKQLDDITKFDDLQDKKRLALAQALAAKEKEINASKSLNAQQKQAEITKAHELNVLEQEQLDEEYDKEYTAVLGRQLKASEGFFEGFQNQALVAADKATEDMENFARLGRDAFNSLQSHAVTAFEAMGEGAESGTDIMKGFFLGMLGDMAEKQGSFMLLSGIFPPDPPVLAAGAALLVLAGYLKSQAKGSSSASPSVGGSVGGSIGGGTSPSSVEIKQDQAVGQAKQFQQSMQSMQTATNDQSKQMQDESMQQQQDLASQQADQLALQQEQMKQDQANQAMQNQMLAQDQFQNQTDLVSQSATPKKQVTLQIMGNYFETEQTKTRLLEMIRESTDATDFKYVQIGGK